jgi:hypothetical protein
MTLRGATALGILTGTLGMAAFGGQSVTELTDNGQVVSSHLTLLNGQLMVPVRDIATYLGYGLSISNGTAQLKHSTPAPDLGTTGLPEPFVPPTLSTATPAPPAVTPPAPSPTTLGIPLASGPTGANQNWGLFPTTPAAPPVTLSATLGNSAGFNGFDYKVDSVSDAGAHYKTVYDQRGIVYHPDWKDEKLVVINVTVSNTGQQPSTPPMPGSFGVTVFDDQKIGYPANDFDVRQTFQPNGNDTNYEIMPAAGDQNLLLAPGGMLHYALVASLPKDHRVTQVMFNLPAGTNSADASSGSGATLTVSTAK